MLFVFGVLIHMLLLQLQRLLNTEGKLFSGHREAGSLITNAHTI